MFKRRKSNVILLVLFSLLISENVSFSKMLTPRITPRIGPDNLVKAIANLASIRPELPVEIERKVAEEQPVFVFIPGILGSKLINSDGEVIWGVYEFNCINLSYDPNKKVSAYPLKFFEVYSFKKDIYAPFIDTVNELNFGNLDHLIPFAYDWRQDNRISAEKFDEHLRSINWKVKGKKRKVGNFA